jgi:hypothetical protein
LFETTAPVNPLNWEITPAVDPVAMVVNVDKSTVA